jgi:Domain of unknown function (DUF5916)/Carbohydrate family 9 binding domain-like
MYQTLHLIVFRGMLCVLALILPVSAFSQSSEEEPYQLHIRKAAGVITLDGQLNEADWKTAEKATGFFCNAPVDTSFAKYGTEVWVTYDDNYFYVAARCERVPDKKFVVQSLKRDFSFPVSDGFAVFIDPSSDKTNGFAFSVNPLGVQREGLLQNGGSFGVTTDWDNRWLAETSANESEYLVEIAIPFKTLRYKTGGTEWRINFSRNDLGANELSTWVPVPRSNNVATLSFSGLLLWDEPLKKPGFNAAFIPYALGAGFKDYTNQTSSIEPNAGADAKISITPSLNLDLTVNPDFSQIEVDRQVTNLSRFNLFFPERRQFFIENSDLFAQVGFRAIRPFFSRQIGLDQGLAVPIIGGIRLSGKLNNNWRIGLMDMLTEGGTPQGSAAQNFSVFAVQRKVFNRSSITGIFVNRQAFKGSKAINGDYNSVAGIEFNLATRSNKLTGKGFYLYSFDSQTKNYKSANAVWLAYNSRHLFAMYNHEWVDRNFNAEVGFVPRLNFLRFEPEVNYLFLPKKGKIANHGPGIYNSQYFDNSSWKFTDNELRLYYKFNFSNRSLLNFNVTDTYTYLLFPFDPTRSGLTPLADSTGYRYRFASANFESDFRKTFSYKLSTRYGSYFNGERFSNTGEVTFRAQPWGIFSVAVEQNYFIMPDTTVSLYLISPRVEISFTRALFFTTFFQFNTQTNNFNINARFQWRFKPMSDLYIVWTDNYATDDFSVKNRALVLKLNYWFSL